MPSDTSKFGNAITARTWERIERLDHRVIGTLTRISHPLLRISLGIVFLWFGLLKVVGHTPVAELVAETVYWLDASWVVPALGWLEVAVGAGLLLRKGLRLVLALFVIQMFGTFLVLIVQPEVAFRDSNPFVLTTEGEFVVKNLVLLSAGLVIGARLGPIWPSRR